MSSFMQLTIALVATFALTSAYAPVAFTPRTSATSVNLFGGNKKPAGKGKTEDFLGGKGAKITVREDEDNAMWIEEPKDKDKKKPAPKRK
ncbi:hypothetical protein MPSEU_000836700 [Mayamaea pseudoterrestris]|nr:hypothetical protein MPSEU_000836700 [Mayamaea pseudoterrestris]